MKRILIMGPPGSGKGTQAALVAAHHGIPAISTGEIFRENVRAGTALGQTARSYIEAGEYVPDSVTNAMVRDRLAQPDCSHGFLLDGYPRTITQIATLDDILKKQQVRLDAIVTLDVAGDELVERLLRRADLEQRQDDSEDVIRRRLKIYADETAPLLAEYEARGILRVVDGTGSVEVITARIFAALGAGAGA
jgi:adenylate kinase